MGKLLLGLAFALSACGSAALPAEEALAPAPPSCASLLEAFPAGCQGSEACAAERALLAPAQLAAWQAWERCQSFSNPPIGPLCPDERAACEAAK